MRYGFSGERVLVVLGGGFHQYLELTASASSELETATLLGIGFTGSVNLKFTENLLLNITGDLSAGINTQIATANAIAGAFGVSTGVSPFITLASISAGLGWKF